jgi:tRNA threonylcarbamoyladenosine biosynthesis protein TsaB
MSLILNIDTSTETAHVSIAKDGTVLQAMFNKEQNNHAAFLQPAIKKILIDAEISMHEIDAVAVTEGPGSYTGLRIGMASAKGLCYALNKSLITIGTLEVLTNAAIEIIQQQSSINQNALLCPMIDARRMEVFTAVYDMKLKNIMPPSAVVLDDKSFEDLFSHNHISFFGSGSEKWKAICKNANAFFYDIAISVNAMSKLSKQKFDKKKFADIAYSEPLYIKEFYINK